jgi:2-polyprenyl-3-methyl-5-hydroxy-6-metoxy-1,4-benzoquinol methylase
MISLREFDRIGREHRYTPQLSFPIRAFTWLCGSINLHPRIRSGHVIRTIQQLDLPKDARVLDAGCGRGLVLFWLAARYSAYRLHGIEIDSARVARNQAVARKMGLTGLTFEQGDLSNIDIAKAMYDLIFSVDVLEHIEDDVGVLRAMRGALKPDGVLILHLPLRHQDQHRSFPVFKHHIVDDHVRDEYLPEEIGAKLEATGFDVQDLRYGFGWQGELAFELNNLCWEMVPIRALLALLTFPLAWYLAYRDVNAAIPRGNSMIILARPKG